MAITIVIATLYYSILPQLGLGDHQAIARCPNGTHKSPSGTCEQVVPHVGLPRCPNGFHRSPNGTCEAVNGAGSNPVSNNENNNAAGITNGLMTEPNTSSNVPSSQAQCDQSLWNHVYNPTRLQIIESCKTVSGVIDSIRVEQDGDYHVRLKLDPQYANIINSANIDGQFGDLVVEPICENPVTQQDAIAACANFHQNINIPPLGTHVTVTGAYVLDQDHGGWAEIHPVTSILWNGASNSKASNENANVSGTNDNNGINHSLPPTYVIQIRPSDGQTFYGGAITKYFTHGRNTTIILLNSSGAYDSGKISCSHGDAIVAFAYGLSSDVTHPIVTVGLLNGGKIIQLSTSVGLISDNPIPPLANIRWICP